MSDPMLFIKESRHIFSVCPECGVVHRLNDLRISREGKYPSDWLDKIDDEHDTLVMHLDELETKRKEYQKVAIEKAEAVELPKLLQKVAPSFIRWKTDPRDVRTIFNPVEFVVFDGMNSDDGVHSVSLVHLGGRTDTVRSIEKAIERREFGWRTLHVDDCGTVSERQGRSRRGKSKPIAEAFHLD